MKRQIAVLVAVAAACLAAVPAGAAMYRCGSSFQDRPCDNSAEQQTIKPGRGAGKAIAPTPAPAASAASPSASAAAPVAARAASAAGAASAPAAAAATPAPAAGSGNLACGNLREQRAALDARMRAGGSAATMEMFQRQRREVESNLAEARC